MRIIKMSVTWTNEIELIFLENYQAEPILWDPKHLHHKNKLKTHDAWTRISGIMEIPVPDLKRKRDSLLSSYRSYKTKVKKSLSSGAGADDVYKPVWFAYELMDAFLSDTTKCNKTINTVSNTLFLSFIYIYLHNTFMFSC